MKIAYLIFAHKYPWQVNRLIKKLQSGDSRVYLHIDAQVDIKPFRKALAGLPVEFIFPRERCAWGRIGIVRATLNGFRRIIRDGESEYVVLLSGQCYPVTSQAYRHNFFENNKRFNYVHYSRDLVEVCGVNAPDRIARYHYVLFRDKLCFPPKAAPVSAVGKVLNLALRHFFPMPRLFPKYCQPWGGSSWLNLSIDSVRYIIDFIAAHPDYLRFHAFTANSDEIFFHSILLSAPEHISANTVCSDLRYADWSKPVKPAILQLEDFDVIKNVRASLSRKFEPEKALFVRKFDPTSVLLMDRIDKELLI